MLRRNGKGCKAEAMIVDPPGQCLEIKNTISQPLLKNGCLEK